MYECEHKRIVELRCTYDSLQSLLERKVSQIIGRDIEVLFDLEPPTSTKPAYLVQRYSDKWREYTNVVSSIDIDVKEKLKVVKVHSKEVRMLELLN